ncbi:superinfection immunity protein [Methyloferula stellata]|uniref:superinfection immunity protein n=1 Tax=Methyloferula stellata TaxID=876270 RepID=UPI0003792A5B
MDANSLNGFLAHSPVNPFALFILIFVFVIYPLPTYLAFFRGHPSKWQIGALNIFLGYTFIFWVFAAVWALAPRPTR